MTRTDKTTSNSYSVHVFRGLDLLVVSGANLGDPLSEIDDLCLGDVYLLSPGAEPHQLTIRDAATTRGQGNLFLRGGSSGQTVHEDSDAGHAGEAVQMDGRITLMAPDGTKTELLVIRLKPEGRAPASVQFLPLTPIEPKVSYTLVACSHETGDVQLSDITPVAFTRGTKITMGDGRQLPVEELKIGDRILTRDRGAQPVRWIGQRTVRAIGAYAPVVISKGTLANASNMIVSQYQRLFIYQSGPERLAERAEILVRARDLVDEDAVYVRPGGFVEYFHIVMDRHDIIYAECIPTESLLMDESALGRLPVELAREVAGSLPEMQHSPHFGHEPAGDMVGRIGQHLLRPVATQRKR